MHSFKKTCLILSGAFILTGCAIDEFNNNGYHTSNSTNRHETSAPHATDYTTTQRHVGVNTGSYSTTKTQALNPRNSKASYDTSTNSQSGNAGFSTTTGGWCAEPPSYLAA